MRREEVGAYEAKAKLSELLRRVEKGERFVITRFGTIPSPGRQGSDQGLKGIPKKTHPGGPHSGRAHVMKEMELRKILLPEAEMATLCRRYRAQELSTILGREVDLVVYASIGLDYSWGSFKFEVKTAVGKGL